MAERPTRRRAGLAVVLLGVAVGVSLLVVAALPRSEDSTHAAVGRPAPDFRLPDLRHEDRTVELSSFRGRPVVLNFWASWCVPCRRELRDFQAAHRELGQRVTFVGIDRLDDRGEALELLRDTGVTYPSAYDRGGTLDRPYGLRGMPTTVLIAADGTVLEHVTGQVSASRLERLLRQVGAE